MAYEVRLREGYHHEMIRDYADPEMMEELDWEGKRLGRLQSVIRDYEAKYGTDNRGE